jgi:type II secretory pathway component GspD/PulD (secretin)
MGGTLQGPKIISAAIALFFVAIPCIAAQETAPEGGTKMNAITETAPGLRTVVSIDAEDAYLPSVLSILAYKSGFNIVTGPGVQKDERISIHLKDTPIEEAMNLVVRAAGLSYEIVGNSFLVAKASMLKEQVGLNSYVLNLQYANAIDVKEMLKDFNATIQVDKSGNKLMIITTPKIITDLERVVKNIDQPSLQITLAARLIEVGVEDEERLGINWSKLSTKTGEYIYEGNTAPTSTATGGTQLQPFEQFNSLNDIGKTVWRSQPIYEIALDWLLKNSRAEVLANTKVTTMNSKTAMIELVDEVPYVTSSGGVGGQVSVQREEAGIKLSITPQVNTDGYITVNIHPEVSSVFEFIGPDQSVPRIVRRSADMTIRVKNHQAIVVGGLMGIVASKTTHKVPFLGDLPFVGGIFRYSVDLMKKTDLIIEVTPHILVDEYTYIGKSDGIKDSEDRYKEDLDGGVDEEKEEEQDQDK